MSERKYVCENGSVGAYLCTPTPFPLCPEVRLRLRASYAARVNQPTHPGRRVAPSMRQFTISSRGINEACSKGHGADSGKTLYWRIGAAYLASEITSGLPVAIAGRLRDEWQPLRVKCADTKKAAAPGGACRDGIRPSGPAQRHCDAVF